MDMKYRYYILTGIAILSLSGVIISGKLSMKQRNSHSQMSLPENVRLPESVLDKKIFPLPVLRNIGLPSATKLQPEIFKTERKNMLTGGSSLPTVTEKISSTKNTVIEGSVSLEIEKKLLTDAIPDDLTGTKYDAQITTKIVPVIWPSPDIINKVVLNALPLASQEVVPKSPIPVLIPASHELATVAVVRAKQYWYNVSIRQPGISISIDATKIAHVIPNINVFRRSDYHVRGDVNASVGPDEVGWKITWEEFNVAYNLTLACHDLKEPQCVDDTYIRELVDSLVFVGGVY